MNVQHKLASLAAALVLAALLPVGFAAAESAQLPQLSTNESYLNEVLAKPVLKIDDALSVFAYVLGQLPERVKVYPTENYYYFRFYHNHVRYAGNVRFDILDRDQGKVHFAYYLDMAQWKDEDPVRHVVLDQRRGVKVEKRGDLAYRVTYRGKSVLFELNDLRNVKPPASVIGPDETYLGPVFDESGIRFFLMFNRKLKMFLYLLDETVPVADQFTPLQSTDRILVGKRTGFAFYRDDRRERKILIGVYSGNSQVNNYFDGPFDQLPDNFIKGDILRDAILAVQPDLKGKIDRLGIAPGGDDRYLIAPYMYYNTDEDLERVQACTTDKTLPADNYYECFVWDDDDDDSDGQEQNNGPTQPPAKQP
jgi:hypothetical protein